MSATEHALQHDGILAPGDPLLGQQIGGRYRIQSLLAKGGMGVVYEAVHEDLGRPAALKVLGPAWASDETNIQRFQREAQIVSRLGHPHIVTIYDFGRLGDGRPYLAMERLRGESLADALEREGSFSFERTLRVVEEVADALDAVHAEELVHRDIKPENIFLARRSAALESAQLLDFGLATFAHRPPGQARLTQQGEVNGTPFYMAPEAATGETECDHRADVYSLAVVTFELLSGVLPFAGQNPLGVLSRKCNEPAPSMRSVSGREFPEAVERALARALYRFPAARQASAGDFARDLREALSSATMTDALDGSRPARFPLTSEGLADDPHSAGQQDCVAHASGPPVLPQSSGARALGWPSAFVAVLALVAGVVALWPAEGAHRNVDEHVAEPSTPSNPEEPPVTEPQKANPAPPASQLQPEVTDRASEGRAKGSGGPTPEGDEAVRRAADSDSRERGDSPSRADGERGVRRPRARARSGASAAEVEKWTQQGTQALVQGRVAEAIRLFEAVTEQQPGKAAAWRSLGFAYERLKRHQAARRAYRRYLRLSPQARDAELVRERIEAL